MPLSEDEKRILRQIEQELGRDPEFSRHGYRVSRRRLVLLGAGLVVGIGLTILGLGISYWLAFAGFVAVLVVAALLEAEIRIIGRERLGTLPISAWLGANRGRGPRRSPSSSNERDPRD